MKGVLRMDFSRLMAYVKQNKSEFYKRELAAHQMALEQAKKATEPKQSS